MYIKNLTIIQINPPPPRKPDLSDFIHLAIALLMLLAAVLRLVAG